jgi:hypothetical protein
MTKVDFAAKFDSCLRYVQLSKHDMPLLCMLRFCVMPFFVVTILPSNAVHAVLGSL